MKTLYLIRHAKSDWSNPFLSDFNRPLNKRGEKNAPFMGKLLASKKVMPDLIISSPANRAKTTAKKIAKKINYMQNIVFEESIYEANSNDLENLIKKLDNKYNKIFLVGHNPSFNIFTSSFVDFYENIPTCGIVQLEFDINNWDEINSKNAKLVSFEYPKKYK